MAKQKDKPVKKVRFLESEAVKASIKKYEQARDAFDKQLDNIIQKSGRSLKEMKDYAENPNNFSKRQWEALQKEKQKLEKIRADLEKDRNPKRLTNPAHQEKKKTKRRLRSRRDWIPM